MVFFKKAFWSGIKLKGCLLLGRKVMTNLDSILKSRDTTFLTKVRIVKAMVFPVVVYGCESWTINKAERWRIDAFELWCWRMPGASVRCSARGKGHEEGGSAYTKAGSSLRSPPGYSRASTPKTRACLLLCALTYTSDFTGGCPPPPLSEKVLT